MRARRREINIFNMSLLDILCGALGAFCFMMIVALPYYIPPGSGLELRKAQAETERLLLAIGNLKERLPDEKSIEEMERLLRELEAQVKALQGRVNILTSENEKMRGQINQLTAHKEELLGQVNQLTAEKQALQEQVNQLRAEIDPLKQRNQELTAKNDELTRANEKLVALLAQRKPFVVVANAVEISQLIDILVTGELAGAKTSAGPNAGFKQWVDGNSPLSMIRSLLSGRGNAIDIKTDAPLGAVFKIYLRLANGPSTRGATVINSALFEAVGVQPPTRLPKLTLSPERFWELFGTITIDPSYRPIFKEATAAERDAEWKALTEVEPPAAPTPTPTPAPLTAAEREAAAAARAKRLVSSEKFNRLMKLTHGPPGKEAEVVALADELLKELPRTDGMRRQVENMRERALANKARQERQQQQQSSPVPVPSPSATP